MKRTFWLRKLPIALLISGMVISAAAWQTGPGKTKQATNDTVPDRNKKPKDIDEALEQLEKSKVELQRTLEKQDWDKEMKEALDKAHFDAEKMKQQMAEAMKSFDAQKVQAELQKAMKEIDVVKMKADLEKSFDKIDMAQAKEEIAKAMKEFDAEKIKADLDASLAKVDMEKIKAEMQRIKEIDFKEIEENIKKIQPQIEQSMKDAKISIEKAKQDLLEYKNFIDGLEKDGLINKKQNYTIEYKNGELTINGKKQPDQVVKKYNSFLKDRKDFTIRKDDDDFNIDND
jgi:hypothetical protein